MLTKEDLLVCQAPPNIKDVSLALYKAFAEEYLIGRIFRYTFTDGSVLNVQFTEWGIYHMLAIQHINGKIDRNNFFEQIEAGLDLNELQATDALKYRFKKFKKRITTFACIYQVMISGKIFYMPTGCVEGTSSVQMDYIAYKAFVNISPTGKTMNGLNVGIRENGGIFVPLTMLISRNSNIEEYIETAVPKIVKCLEIIDGVGKIIDKICHSV